MRWSRRLLHLPRKPSEDLSEVPLRFGEFSELCVREWRENRGDVTVLWLTSESYKELQDDAASVIQGQGVLFRDNGSSQAASRLVYNPGGGVPREVNLRLNTVVNPCTGTPVRMKLARDCDVCDVWVGGRVETRFLEPDTALDLQYRSKWDDED
jgi:hypothetical protein